MSSIMDMLYPIGNYFMECRYHNFDDEKTLIFHEQKHATVKSKLSYRQHEQHDIFRI